MRPREVWYQRAGKTGGRGRVRLGVQQRCVPLELWPGSRSQSNPYLSFSGTWPYDPSNSPPAQRGSDPSTRRLWTPAAAAGHVPCTSRARVGHGPQVITRGPNTSRAISSWARSIVRAEPECGIHSNTLGQNGPDYHYYRPGPGLEGLQSLTRRPPTQAAQPGQTGSEGRLP